MGVDFRLLVSIVLRRSVDGFERHQWVWSKEHQWVCSG